MPRKRKDKSIRYLPGICHINGMALTENQTRCPLSPLAPKAIDPGGIELPLLTPPGFEGRGGCGTSPRVVALATLFPVPTVVADGPVDRADVPLRSLCRDPVELPSVMLLMEEE